MNSVEYMFLKIALTVNDKSRLIKEEKQQYFNKHTTNKLEVSCKWTETM